MTRVHPEQLTKDWQSVLRFVTGGAVSKEIEQQALSAISRDMDREERLEAKRRDAWARISAQARAIRRDAGARDARVAKVQAPLRAALKKWREHELVVPVAVRDEASLSVGSLSATIPPPYDFLWTNSKSGGPADVHDEARKTDGYLSSNVSCPENGDASWGRAWSAVGIFFKPPIDGSVVFSSTIPSIISYWYTAASNADAESAGKIGLRVYRFVKGKQNPPDTYLIQHSVYLWQDSTSAGLFEVEGDGPYSDAYSPPQTSLALQFAASKDASYNLWVYFKTAASADGGDLTSDSAAQAEMNGFVSSMQWKLSL